MNLCFIVYKGEYFSSNVYEKVFASLIPSHTSKKYNLPGKIIMLFLLYLFKKCYVKNNEQVSILSGESSKMKSTIRLKE